MLFSFVACGVCPFFTFSLAFPLASLKARWRFPQNDSCLLANLLTAVLLFVPCLTTDLLSSSPLKQPLIILNACPLEQSVFDSHYIVSGCLYPRWQKKQKTAHPILVRSASGLGGNLPAGQGRFCVWLPEQNHLHSLLLSCLPGDVF